MAEEARQIGFADKLFVETAEATRSQFEIYKAPNGEAGVYLEAASVATGRPYELTTRGKFQVLKTSGVVILKGQRVYWDHSANTATYAPNNDRDFYCGRASKDSGAGAATVEVDLNIDPPYDIDMNRDSGASVLVGTPAAGGFGYPVKLGGSSIFELAATNEAQKVDWLSTDGFSVDSNAIVEMGFRVLSDGGSGTQDFSLGIANATHASDFTAIAEFMSVHLDGNDTDVQIGSDDGTTDTAEIDSTVQYTEGSTRACRVYVTFDLRDKSDIQVYINGANVLPSSTFSLAAATGPMFLIAHLEKTATTDTYKVAVDHLRAYFPEQ